MGAGEEEMVERTNEQKLEDWNKLLLEYKKDLFILESRREDILFIMERLHDMIKRVQG